MLQTVLVIENASLSQNCSGAGLIGLAFLPDLFSNPFIGILISVIIYAIGSGLIEVLCSPIVEACPFEHKEATMSLLHSFYCWGSVGVILLSTVFFSVFGIDNWKWLACIWALVPLYNIYNFATCPIEHPTGGEKGMTIKGLFQVPLFWVSIILMICAGASGTIHGTVGICLYRICPWFLQNCGRFDRSLYVCHHHGNQPGNLR